MRAHISCTSLTKIGLQMRRWRTKWQPCKSMAVSQAFMFHFKCYSILHFADCQFLCWAFLLHFIVMLIQRVLFQFIFQLMCLNIQSRSSNEHTHTQTHTHIRTHARTHARTNVRTNVRTHARTHAHTHTLLIQLAK